MRGLAGKGGIIINKKELEKWAEKLKTKKLPFHVAIIMDGNGRWARKRGLPREEGHRRGVETLKKITQSCGELGVKHLTVYAFSTENWRRPRKEVNFLMDLFHRTFDKEAAELVKKRVRVLFLGNRKKLASGLQNLMEKLEKDTSECDGINLNIALNYGSRQEIVEAAEVACRKEGGDFSEIDLEKYFYNPNLPEVDLLIRPGGEKRLSNFLLWQAAYAELYFTEVFWPDFAEIDLYKAVEDFQNRKRRFGRVGGE